MNVINCQRFAGVSGAQGTVLGKKLKTQEACCLLVSQNIVAKRVKEFAWNISEFTKVFILLLLSEILEPEQNYVHHIMLVYLSVYLSS